MLLTLTTLNIKNLNTTLISAAQFVVEVCYSAVNSEYKYNTIIYFWNNFPTYTWLLSNKSKRILLTLIYRRWSSEPTQPTQASAGRSFSDKVTEQMACLEAQREFIFYLFFQEMVLLLSFFIFLKTNYRISSYT